MLFVDSSTRWLDGAWQASSTVASPVSRSQTDVLLSAVSLSSSPIATGQTEALIEGDRLRALWTDSLPAATTIGSVAPSEMSDEDSTMGDTERSLYTDNEWLAAYMEDIDEFGSCVDTDDYNVPKERCRHIEQYIEHQSLVTLSSIHHPQAFSESIPQPQLQCRSWSAADCSHHLEKQEEEPRRCYYKRLLNMSKRSRKHNKRKAKQYRQAMKEKRSGLFNDEQVVILHCSGDDDSGQDEHEDILVVD